jgi:hypothetical protein
VTNLNPSIQSFDRTIAPSVKALVARADGGKWRFFVTSDKLTILNIVQSGTLASFPNKQRYVAPNSAVEIQGRGSVQVFATNLDAGAGATVKTWNAEYLDGGLEPVYFTEDSLTTPAAAAFGAMGTNGGYAQPFTNHCRIYVDAGTQTRIRATAPDGNVIFSSGAQPVDERLYIDLDTPQGYKFEIRESASGSGVNYGLVWYRS